MCVGGGGGASQRRVGHRLPLSPLGMGGLGQLIFSPRALSLYRTARVRLSNVSWAVWVSSSYQTGGGGGY